jgi:HTH-type transcriptional regulator / antitoxin HipB
MACMHEFPVRSPEQLPTLLQAFRKASGLTQAEVALRLGVTQQTYSALERNASKVSAERLLKLLHLLGVEWVLRATPQTDAALQSAEPSKSNSNGPAW